MGQLEKRRKERFNKRQDIPRIFCYLELMHLQCRDSGQPLQLQKGSCHRSGPRLQAPQGCSELRHGPSIDASWLHTLSRHCSIDSLTRDSIEKNAVTRQCEKLLQFTILLIVAELTIRMKLGSKSLCGT
jgi:hypothetical protein